MNQDESAEGERGEWHTRLSIWSDSDAFLHRYLWNFPWLKVDSGKKLNQAENPTEELIEFLAGILFLDVEHSRTSNSALDQGLSQ